ncbi:unnamed protein product [Spirodela intermedia]|uniref:RING-type E3 ubiquitin transferase n=1 Tax=Spirodela intermedia TaxID=51605 RepID=A0A7I8J5M5_SPIIN|nr:unnamed protein product [Spirodela intermedia]CAA6664703.1 unnamed protein product [Spirodela intermedia]
MSSVPGGADNAGPISVVSAAAGDGGSGSGVPATSTFWCYECDMSVMLVLYPEPLACPSAVESSSRRWSRSTLGHRGGDTLDDSDPLPHIGRAGSGDLDDLIAPSIGIDQRGPESFPAAEDYHDIFDRLIGRIVSSASDDHDTVGGGGGPRPASKSFVETIPAVQITEAFLAAESFLLCAVCKDEFVLQTEARQLPCNHIYHSDCILPWLSRHNSCPVCRFSLPTEEQERRRPSVRVNQLDEDEEAEAERDVREVHSMLRSIFPGNDRALAEAEGDLVDIGSMMRRVRRRRLLLSRRPRLSVAAASSSARLARAEMGSESLSSGRGRVSTGWLLDEESSASESGSGVGGEAEAGLDNARA